MTPIRLKPRERDRLLDIFDEIAIAHLSLFPPRHYQLIVSGHTVCPSIGPNMPVDLPYELFLEVLSYIRFQSPPTLAGLQVGLTCKELYEEFRPLIAKVHLQKLVQQYEGDEVHVHNEDSSTIDRFPLRQFIKHATLALDPVHSQGKAKNIDSRPQKPLKSFNFRFGFSYTPKTFDVNAIWACIYLLSNEIVSTNLAHFALGMDWGQCRVAGSETSIAWARALAKLVQLCARCEECRNITLRTRPPAAGSEETGWEAHEDQLPIPSSTTQLPEFSMSNFIDLPILKFCVAPIIRQSTVTLVGLTMLHCWAPAPLWDGLMDILWHLPQLTSLSILASYLPFRRTSPAAASLNTPETRVVLEKGSMKRLHTLPNAKNSAFLPNLGFLWTNMALLLLFAEAKLDFPALTKLRIEERYPTGSDAVYTEATVYLGVPIAVDFNDLGRVFVYIGGHLTSLENLSLTLPCSAELGSWLESVPDLSADSDATDSPLPFANHPEFPAMFYTLRALPANPSHFRDDPAEIAGSQFQSIIPTSEEILRSLLALKHLKTLSLASYGPGKSWETHRRFSYSFHPSSVVSFIKAFPGLKEVHLLNLFSVLEKKLFANKDAFVDAVETLWESCSGLDGLEIRPIERERRMPAWMTPMLWLRGGSDCKPDFDQYLRA